MAEPSRVELGQKIAISASGIEISLQKVAVTGGSYEGMRPLNPDGKPENDGVVAIIGTVIKGKPAVLWTTDMWITDENGQRNAKRDMASTAKGRGFTLLFNVPKSSRKLVLHFGDAVAIDLAPFLQVRNQ